MRDNASCCAHSPRSWRFRIFVLACLLILVLPFLLAILLLLPDATECPYNYTVSGGQATITEFWRSHPGELFVADRLGGFPVTTIGKDAFYHHSSITAVIIPCSVTSIGESAFSFCKSLTSVTIPNSVTNIGARAFSGNTSLTNIIVSRGNRKYADIDGVLFSKNHTTLIKYPGGISGRYTIPGNVTDIGREAFHGCHHLTSVTIPDSVTNISDMAFSWCDSLTNITVSGSNPKYADVDGVLFNKDRTTLLAYPGGLVGPYTIPDSATAIGNSAFAGCVSLTAVTIPDSITNIGKEAFYACRALTSVTIPDSVTYIGDRAFEECNRLAGVYFCDDAPNTGTDLFYITPNMTATVYRMQGKAGWPDVPDPWQGLPTALWNPPEQER